MKLSRALILALAAAALTTSALAETPVEQAAAAIAASQFARAEDILAPLAQNRRADPAIFYYLSLVRMAQRRNDEAVELAERAMKADPAKIAYLDQMGTACSARIAEVGAIEGNSLALKMRKAYEKCLSIDPNYLPALKGMINFYEHAPDMVGGSLRKAGEYAERLRKVYPYQGELELGRLAAGANKFEVALAHYEAATKLKPDDLATAAACGWTLLHLGRKDEARERFQGVLRVDPNFGPAKMGLAEAAPAAH